MHARVYALMFIFKNHNPPPTQITRQHMHKCTELKSLFADDPKSFLEEGASYTESG